MKQTTLLVCAIILATSAVLAQQVRVQVGLDKESWQYAVGEEATFNVRITKNNSPVKNAVVSYEMGPDMMPELTKENITTKNGTLELKARMKTEGFYRCRAWTTVDGRRYEGMATAGFAPENILPTVDNPADFDQFWTESIRKARTIPLLPKITLLPERCTSASNVYHISFQNDRPGSFIYGILTMPKKEGKYPALLKVPGAGVRPYYGDTRMSDQGVITLEIGIHGIPVNLTPELYERLGAATIYGYFKTQTNDRDGHYYKRVIVGCVKAVDFIESLPQYNGTDVAVTGGSQGGALSIITAGLDKRIKCLAALYPAMCDHTGYLNGRAGGWPHYYRGGVKPKENEVETLRYFDVVNFARRITVPGWYAWGFNDITCPPTSMYAAYNVITAPKELALFLETGHWMINEEREECERFILQKLNIK